MGETSVAKLLIRGAQCGYQGEWTTHNSRINYDGILLDTGSGSLDRSRGEWKSEEKGLYQVSWSLSNSVDSGKTETNDIYLYKNGAALQESLHVTQYRNSEGYIFDHDGRTMLLELNVNDRLHLQTGDHFDGKAHFIYFCVQLLYAA